MRNGKSLEEHIASDFSIQSLVDYFNENEKEFTKEERIKHEKMLEKISISKSKRFRGEIDGSCL